MRRQRDETLWFEALRVPPMPRVHSFDPIADESATRLVLGSMPGRISLAQSEYYAHPRNAFWPIVEALLGLPAGLAYRERCRALRLRGVALWDVLQLCTRAGSLDSDIVADSIVPNDFRSFLERHTRIEAVFFNGAKAAEIYRRHVVPTLPAPLAALPTRRLPSTSPAHAALDFEAKLELWRRVLAVEP
ncbi:MAG: DNA-deoxyinosine glycosylase [Planctomycetota bacterium]